MSMSIIQLLRRQGAPFPGAAEEGAGNGQPGDMELPEDEFQIEGDIGEINPEDARRLVGRKQKKARPVGKPTP